MAMRRQLADELAPLRKNALEDHPWRDWASAAATTRNRMPGAQSRWSGGKDLSLGGAAARARVRSEIRPPAGRSLPPCRRVPALAPGQAAAGLPLRPAGSDDAVRAGKCLRRQWQELLGASSRSRLPEAAPHGTIRGSLRRLQSPFPEFSLVRLALCRRNPAPPHLRHHLPPRRGQDHADGKAAAVLRRDPDRRLGQGAQGLAPRHLRLDGDREAARHLGGHRR